MRKVLVALLLFGVCANAGTEVYFSPSTKCEDGLVGLIDNAWETSKTRKISIAILTYFVMVLVMYSLDMSNPFVGAIIPTLGFTLSTFSLDFIKEFWKKF